MDEMMKLKLWVAGIEALLKVALCVRLWNVFAKDWYWVREDGRSVIRSYVFEESFMSEVVSWHFVLFLVAEGMTEAIAPHKVPFGNWLFWVAVLMPLAVGLLECGFVKLAGAVEMRRTCVAVGVYEGVFGSGRGMPWSWSFAKFVSCIGKGDIPKRTAAVMLAVLQVSMFINVAAFLLLE